MHIWDNVSAIDYYDYLLFSGKIELNDGMLGEVYVSATEICSQ